MLHNLKQFELIFSRLVTDQAAQRVKFREPLKDVEVLGYDEALQTQKLLYSILRKPVGRTSSAEYYIGVERALKLMSTTENDEKSFHALKLALADFAHAEQARGEAESESREAWCRLKDHYKQHYFPYCYD